MAVSFFQEIIEQYSFHQRGIAINVVSQLFLRWTNIDIFTIFVSMSIKTLIAKRTLSLAFIEIFAFLFVQIFPVIIEKFFFLFRRIDPVLRRTNVIRRLSAFRTSSGKKSKIRIMKCFCILKKDFKIEYSDAKINSVDRIAI